MDGLVAGFGIWLKVNARYPDFMHKKTREALWLVDRKNPPWVEMEMAAMAPGTVDLNPFLWNRRLLKYVKAGEYEKTLGLFRQMQSKGMSPDTFTLVYEHLKRAGMSMNGSFKVVVSLMSLCAVVSLTCMPNAGAWRMLGVCSPRFPQMMWCLGLPSYSHM
jgi:pentatricopeptide repeat protein